MPVLLGREISERWPIIKAALKLSALPVADTNDEKLNNVLTALLDGRAICWMTGNARRPRTVIILTMSVEEISGTRNLLVYCAHSFEREKTQEYINMVESLKEYAINQKCDNIICYVWNDKLKDLLKSYGAECNYTLATFHLH